MGMEKESSPCDFSSHGLDHNSGSDGRGVSSRYIELSLADDFFILVRRPVRIAE
jgi:hypothetical protein